jgi:methionine aminotransferase
MNLQSKLPHIGTTIFAIMTQLANECDAINLSQGFPGFEPPQALRDLVSHHMNAGGKNQYASMAGIPKLREQIALKTAQLYGRAINMDDEITMTNGATQALFVAISTVVRPGDEVILFDPAFDTYKPVVELNGGRTVHIPLLPPDYSIDWQRVQDSLTDKTRLILINTPHNPTGSMLSSTDWETLAGLIRNRNILILSDEVYEHITFDGVPHQSLLCHPELAERAFVVSSFGKTYHATGWKMGYCIAPPQLSAEFRKIHQFMVYSVMTPVQYALADIMEQQPAIYLNLSDFYQQKRDLFCHLVEESRFQFKPTRSTFYQLLDYSDITDMDDVEYARYLTKEIGVASIPISVFYEEKPANRVLRFCFAKDDNILQEATERLCKI